MELKDLKSLLIVNPNCGTLRKRRLISKTIQTLQLYFPELEILFTQKKGDAFEFSETACRRGIEIIWCAGGDGTINEAIQALCGTRILLGIIPTGTGNGLAREIGLSTNPVKAIDQLIEGVIVPVFPGKFNDHIFLLVSGAGYDAFVARQTDQRHPNLKKITGFFSYLIVGVLKGWKYPFPMISAKIDGTAYSCYGLLVMKARGRIGPLTLAPSVSLKENHLAVFLFKKRGLRGIFHFFISFLFRLHMNLVSFPLILCKEITANSKESVPVQYDGESASPLPAFWTTSEKQILLIYPKGKNEK